MLSIRLPAANPISSLPLFSPRSRFPHTDEDDEENKQNRQQNCGNDDEEGDGHCGPLSLKDAEPPR
jgi:hypothetical protein